ncbi:MAG TPA: helix-turn-helix domain-containing protein, partial [Ktedonobacteraceae bacterium]
PSLLTTEQQQELFRALRTLRRSLADEQGQAPFFVFSDSTLDAIVQALPQSQSEFLCVPGVGKRKLEMYYSPFTDAIYAYCASHNIDLTQRVAYEPVPKERRPAIESSSLARNQILELYRQGLSIEEIAQTRLCSPSTVLEHLCRWIEVGEDIDISGLIDAQRQVIIFNAIKEVGDSKLRPVKDFLGDEYSYDEIRLVRAAMRRSPTE